MADYPQFAALAKSRLARAEPVVRALAALDNDNLRALVDVAADSDADVDIVRRASEQLVARVEADGLAARTCSMADRPDINIVTDGIHRRAATLWYFDRDMLAFAVVLIAMAVPAAAVPEVFTADVLSGLRVIFARAGVDIR
jgi:hypothetical protein